MLIDSEIIFKIYHETAQWQLGLTSEFERNQKRLIFIMSLSWLSEFKTILVICHEAGHSQLILISEFESN